MVTTLQPPYSQEFVNRQPTPIRQRTQKRREPPDAQWLQDEATLLKDFWRPQKDRMKEDQSLYELFREEPEEGESRIVRNDPRVLINKVARMLAGAEWRAIFDPDIDPVPSWLGTVSDRDDAATIKEKFVAWVWERADECWREGLNPGLKATLFKQALVRGMMALRVKPAAVEEDSAEQDIYEITPIDPVNLYPRLKGRGVSYYLHIYKTEWSDVQEEWELEDDSKKATDEVEVTTYYDDYYWAVMVDGVYVKEPEEHGLGFNPIVSGVAEGGEFRSDDTNSQQQWVRFVGVGLLEDIRQAILDRNRTATQRDEMINRIINPPAVTWSKDGKPILIDLRNGSLNNLNVEDREDVKLLTPGAASPDIAKMEADEDAQISNGSVPRVLFGDSGNNPMSGYATALTSKNARDILEPWMDLWKGMVKGVNVRLFKMVTNPNIGIPDTITVSGTSGKFGRFRERINAGQMGQDFSHTIEFGDVLPTDLPAILTIAIQAIRDGILTRRTVHEKLLNTLVTDSKAEFVGLMREKAAMGAAEQLGQLGLAALKITMGEQGMIDAFGEANEAPPPVTPESGAPTTGVPSNVLPQAEMGTPPTQIGPGSPEEMGLEQQQAAALVPPVGI